MVRIFLSYRHGDTNAYAGWLFERLQAHFGKGNVFMDVGTLSGGVDFDKEIRAQVETCDLLIALIGSAWLEARNDSGDRRLDRDDDYVRLEIATVLARGALVIPVLTDGTPMPRARDLPEPMRPLAGKQAVELRHKDFDEQITRLIAELDKRFATRRRTEFEILTWRKVVAGILIVGLIGGTYFLQRSHEADQLSSTPSRASNASIGTRPVEAEKPSATSALDVGYWNSVKDSGDINLIRSYLEKFPNGAFATIARTTMTQLEREASDRRLLTAGIVSDRRTGLMWTRHNTDDLSWNMADTFCRELRLAGYTDWRLPVAKEIRTIYDRANITGVLEFSGRRIPIRTIPGFQLNFTHVWVQKDAGEVTAKLFDFSDGDLEQGFDPTDSRWRTRAICVRSAGPAN